MILTTLDDFFFGDQKRKLIVLGTAILLGEATAISSTKPGGAFISVAVIATMAFAVLMKLAYDWIAVARFAASLADFGAACYSILRIGLCLVIGVFLYRSPENLSLLLTGGPLPPGAGRSDVVIYEIASIATLVLLVEFMNWLITNADRHDERRTSLFVSSVKRAIQSRKLTRSQGRLLSRFVLRRMIASATSTAVPAVHLARHIEEIRALNATLESSTDENRPAA